MDWERRQAVIREAEAVRLLAKREAERREAEAKREAERREAEAMRLLAEAKREAERREAEAMRLLAEARREAERRETEAVRLLAEEAEAMRLLAKREAERRDELIVNYLASIALPSPPPLPRRISLSYIRVSHRTPCPFAYQPLYHFGSVGRPAKVGPRGNQRAWPCAVQGVCQ